LVEGQSLDFASTKEVDRDVRQCNHLSELDPINPSHILHWVIRNSIRDLQRGISLFLKQGEHYLRTRLDPDNLIVPTKTDVVSMYGHVQRPQLLREIHDEEIQRLLIAAKASQDPQIIAISRALNDIIHRFGGDEIANNSADDECERELEEEGEEEIEEEREKPTIPIKEAVDWDYGLAYQARSVQELNSVIISIESFCENYLSNEFHHVNWPKDRIYLTTNFAITIDRNQLSNNENVLGFALDCYLLNVDFMLYWEAERTVLLLSDREADKILSLILSAGSKVFTTAGNAKLINYIYINMLRQQLRYQQYHPHQDERLNLVRFPSSALDHHTINDRLLCTAIELFAGETMFPVVDKKDLKSG
jgi:hypothetical protein